MQLRDGTTTADPRLDRLVQFDERSRAFPIRAVIDARQPRSYTWRIYSYRMLDQGQEGACVGFSITHELASRPVEVPNLAAPFAQRLYKAAQRIDPWPGEAYSGTSVLAGVKVAHGMGYFTSYRWAFGLQDVLLGLGYHGPCVLGINWYQGMHRPDSTGRIRPTGSIVGGHAILCSAVNVRERKVWLPNSWGLGWGYNGQCWLSWDDIERLLHEQGEAVFFAGRKIPAT